MTNLAMLTSSMPPAARSRMLRAKPQTVRRFLLTPKWWLEGRYLRVGAIPGSSVVVVERTSAPSGDVDVAEVFGPAQDAMRHVEREKHSLLIDVRLAPGRNDAEFERRFVPYRQSLQRGFRRVAVLVATPHGKLQVQRYAREDRTLGTAFDDYPAAVAWLEESLPNHKR